MLAATARSVTEVLKSKPGVWYISRKHNGVRGRIQNGKLLSRTDKEFPNAPLNRLVPELLRHGYLRENDEMELCMTRWDADRKAWVDLPLEDTMSIVMSKDKEEFLHSGVFRVFGAVGSYPVADLAERLTKLPLQTEYGQSYVVPVVPRAFGAAEAHEAENYYEQIIQDRGEGVIMRWAYADYKHGRSTLKHGGLIKVKPLDDAEFEVLGCTQEIAKDGTPKDSLGALILKSPAAPGSFQCGAGFTAKQRHDLWLIRNTLCGQKATVEFADRFAKTGIPQFPVFVRFREDE